MFGQLSIRKGINLRFVKGIMALPVVTCYYVRVCLYPLEHCLLNRLIQDPFNKIVFDREEDNQE